jgi:hypothetical protein
VNEKSGQVSATIELKRNDAYINRHNRTMLEYWGANVDLTIIIDMRAAAAYLTKYIAKAETRGRYADEIFRAVLLNAAPESNPQSKLRSVMLKSIESRGTGKFEAMHQIMGLPMHRTTAKMTTLSLDIGTREIVQPEVEGGPLEIKENLTYYYRNRYVLPRFPFNTLNSESS